MEILIRPEVHGEAIAPPPIASRSSGTETEGAASGSLEFPLRAFGQAAQFDDSGD